MRHAIAVLANAVRGGCRSLSAAPEHHPESHGLLHSIAHAWLVVIIAGFLAVDADAITHVVPDDFPTIQEAFDAIPEFPARSDTILVRDGSYPERVHIRRGAALLNFPSPDGYRPAAVPRVLALTIDPRMYPRDLTVRGFHVVGSISDLSNDFRLGSGRLSFVTCRVDSAVRLLARTSGAEVIGCTVLGGMEVHAFGARIAQNTVVGGMDIWGSGYGDVRSNVVLGPAAIGIAFVGSGGESALESNLVAGATDGIHDNGGNYPLTMRDNEVRDCSGTAFRGSRYVGFGGPGGTLIAIGNRALRCGGYGFDMDQAYPLQFSGNTADSCGLDGLWMTSVGRPIVDHNVFGHCGGAGMRLTIEHPFVRNNTVYDNAGSGMILGLAGEDSVMANISVGNGGFGLELTGTGAPVLACNDWFANGAGAVSGSAPGASDLEVDPLFCDAGRSDVRLRADSPLADAPACGAVGALGVGCPGLVTPTLVTRFEAVDVGGAVDVRWQLGPQAMGGGVVVESAHDASGPWMELARVPTGAGGGFSLRDVSGTGLRYYRLVVTLPDGRTETLGPVTVTSTASPRALDLAVSGENPAPGTVALRLGVPRDGHVRITVFDVQGREVATIANRTFAAGWHVLTWPPDGAPSGICFVRVQAGGETRVARVVLAR